MYNTSHKIKIQLSLLKLIHRKDIMSSPSTFEEINIIITNLTNEVCDLKKKNEDLSCSVKDLNKSNNELKEEISSVKDKIEKLERDDSLNRSPQQTLSQNRGETKKEIIEIEEDDEPTNFQEVVAIEEENEPSTGTHLQPKPGRTKRMLSQSLSLFQRTNFQTSPGSNIFNTNNIGMLAASIAYQRSQNRTSRARILMWIMALSLLAFLLMQVFLFFILQEDSTSQACTKHSDCQQGKMCNGFSGGWRHPRCEPCVYLENSEDPCEVDVDLEDIFESSWFDSNFTPNVNIEAENFSNIFSSEHDAMRCIAEQYCEATSPVGLSRDNCSFIKQLKEKAGVSGYIILLFMSLLFAVYLYKDMKEAEVENALLDFIISSELTDSLWVSMFIIRITNRARRLILPFYAAYAGAAIILTDDLSAKNIVLNLLALIFILEADNLIAVLAITENQQEKAENLVEVAKSNNVRIGQAEIKRDALLVSMFMFVVCVKIEWLMELPFFGCMLGLTLNIVLLGWGPFAFMIYKFVGNLVFGEKPKKLVRSVLVFLRMYIGFWVMGLMVSISHCTMSHFGFSEIPPVPYIVGSISSVCVVFRPRKMLADSYVNSWKNKVINVVMTLAWLFVQGWAYHHYFSEVGLI